VAPSLLSNCGSIGRRGLKKINVGATSFTSLIESLFGFHHESKQIFERFEKSLDKMSVLFRNLVLKRTNVRKNWSNNQASQNTRSPDVTGSPQAQPIALCLPSLRSTRSDRWRRRSLHRRPIGKRIEQQASGSRFPDRNGRVRSEPVGPNRDARDWVAEVIDLNALGSADLYPGQQLALPGN
jgi:hypothetical protein